jgi:hypothetical protein
MPKFAFAPFRKAEIIGLAAYARKKYEGLTLDQVAERENIILVREPDANSKKAGYACSLKSERPKLIPSLSRPGEYILSFREKEIIFHDCIVINSLYGIPEREIFWHEFYYLWYSPSRKTTMDFFHQYSTGGALDAQEERRANMFAACMLRPEVDPDDKVLIVSEKFTVGRDMHQLYEDSF